MSTGDNLNETVVKSTARALQTVISRYVSENTACSLVVPIGNDLLQLVLLPSHDLSHEERHLRRLVPQGGHREVLRIIASILGIEEIGADSEAVDVTCLQIMTTGGSLTAIVRNPPGFG